MGLPNDKNPIRSKWVFTVKSDGAGNTQRHRVRLVVKGCAQKYGTDYIQKHMPQLLALTRSLASEALERLVVSGVALCLS